MMKATVLLPDESYCKTDLGILLYKSRKIYGFHAEVINVKDPIGFFGHVEYDINIRAMPHNSLNFENRNFVLTSRFKELNRLHSHLATIHRQLYLKNTFPNFVEAKVFGSTSPETITERRRAIETFLNFVLKSEVLCKSRVLQTFIEGAKEQLEDDTMNADRVEEAANESANATASNTNKSCTDGSSNESNAPAKDACGDGAKTPALPPPPVIAGVGGISSKFGNAEPIKPQ